jgi:hypothetical protein
MVRLTEHYFGNHYRLNYKRNYVDLAHFTGLENLKYKN